MSEKNELLQKLRLTVGDRCKLVNLPSDFITFPDGLELVDKRASIIICYASSTDELVKVLKKAIKSLAPRVNLNVIFPSSLISSSTPANNVFESVFSAGFRRITSFSVDAEHRAIRFYYDESYGQSRRIELAELAQRSQEIRQKYQADS